MAARTNTLEAAKTADAKAGHVVCASKDSAPTVQGRRDFFTYRDLGVADASGGKMSAQIHSTIRGLPEATGWHYHTCDCQFIFVLKGWVDLEFESGEKHHLEAGHSCFIPGGVRHNETDMSQDFEVLEIHMPADRMGTVACDPPQPPNR